MLLTPCDSTVITYGVTDSNGRFTIPCDKKNVLAKFTCVGYKTAYANMSNFATGTATMQMSPIQLSVVSVEADNTLYQLIKTYTYLHQAKRMHRKMLLIFCAVWLFLSW